VTGERSGDRLAKDEEGRCFDTQAGIEESLDRRIGLNELHAIATARAFVDAEREYAAADPDGDGIRAYAARLWRREGKRDGLYWPAKEGDPESPMGPQVAEAVEEGYQVREEGEGPRPTTAITSGSSRHWDRTRPAVPRAISTTVAAAIDAYNPDDDWEPVVD
jgi:hypothetical protein